MPLPTLRDQLSVPTRLLSQHPKIKYVARNLCCTSTRTLCTLARLLTVASLHRSRIYTKKLALGFKMSPNNARAATHASIIGCGSGARGNNARCCITMCCRVKLSRRRKTVPSSYSWRFNDKLSAAPDKIWKDIASACRAPQIETYSS